MDKELKIKYPLNEDEKQSIRDRLNEVLEQEDGEQVIILWDKKKLTDYYQNTCVPRLISGILNNANDHIKRFGEGLISLTENDDEEVEITSGDKTWKEK